MNTKMQAIKAQADKKYQTISEQHSVGNKIFIKMVHGEGVNWLSGRMMKVKSTNKG